MANDIIYSVIVRKKKTILCEYTNHSGNFQQIVMKIIQKLNITEQGYDTFKSCIQYENYRFFCLKINFLFLISLSEWDIEESDKSISQTQDEEEEKFYYSFLYKINELLMNTYTIEKLKTCPGYSLKEFVQVLKQQTEKFSDSPVNFTDTLNQANKLLFIDIPSRQINSDAVLSVIHNSMVHEKIPSDFDEREVRPSTYYVTKYNDKNESLLGKFVKKKKGNKKKLLYFLFFGIFLVIIGATIGILVYCL